MTGPDTTAEFPGKSYAVIGEGLYLLNLLFPVISLLGLAWFYFRYRDHETAMVRSHLRQAFIAAVISTLLFMSANMLIILLGGYRSLHALIIFEVYCIAIVPLFLIPGLLGLIKAMAGQSYRYPLIGRSE